MVPRCTSISFLCSYVRRSVRLSAGTVNLMLGMSSHRRRCQCFWLQVLVTSSRCKRLVFLLKAWSQFRVSLFLLYLAPLVFIFYSFCRSTEASTCWGVGSSTGQWDCGGVLNFLNASFSMPEYLSYFVHSYTFAGEASIRRLLGELASSGYSRFGPLCQSFLQGISDGEVIDMSAPDTQAEVNSCKRM